MKNNKYALTTGTRINIHLKRPSKQEKGHGMYIHENTDEFQHHKTE